jgi:hypothetical protein
MQAKHAKGNEIKITGLSLSLDDIATLARFAKDASKVCGRPIGRSVLVRALLAHLGTQSGNFVEEHLAPRIRADLEVRPWGGHLRKKPVKKRARVKQ